MTSFLKPLPTALEFYFPPFCLIRYTSLYYQASKFCSHYLASFGLLVHFFQVYWVPASSFDSFSAILLGFIEERLIFIIYFELLTSIHYSLLTRNMISFTRYCILGGLTLGTDISGCRLALIQKDASIFKWIINKLAKSILCCVIFLIVSYYHKLPPLFW